MGPILPLHALVIHEADVGLVDQRAGLKVVVGALASHVPVRQPAELRLHDRRQLVEGELVFVAPGTEELADIVDRHGCRFRGPLDDCWIVLPRPDRSAHNSSSRCRHCGYSDRPGFLGLCGFRRPRSRGDAVFEGNARGAVAAMLLV